jgi:hypothetical protein
MKWLLFAIALGGALSGCAALPHPARPRPTGIVEKPVSAAWRNTIKLADATAIDAMQARWAAARAQAGKAAARAIAAQGVLLDGAALDHPAPSPGPYRCRHVRLGVGGVRTYPAATCFIGGDPGDMLSFTSQSRADAPGGWLYPDDVTTRYVFLGARQRTGTGNLAYGDEPARDIAGVVERIANFRWRLVIPGATGTLDVYDLTPIPGAAPAK